MTALYMGFVSFDGKFWLPPVPPAYRSNPCMYYQALKGISMLSPDL